MAGDVLWIALLALGPAVLQVMAISVYLRRMAQALRRADDRPPFTTMVEIVEFGGQPRAVTRLLERRTRLDLEEIDALVARCGGLLPLPMSRSAALRLVRELQALGAGATTYPRAEGRRSC